MQPMRTSTSATTFGGSGGAGSPSTSPALELVVSEVARKLRLAASAERTDDRNVICEELFADITCALDAQACAALRTPASCLYYEVLARHYASRQGGDAARALVHLCQVLWDTPWVAPTFALLLHRWLFASVDTTSGSAGREQRTKLVNVLLHGSRQLLLGDVQAGLSRFYPLWAFLAFDVVGLPQPLQLPPRPSAGPGAFAAGSGVGSAAPAAASAAVAASPERAAAGGGGAQESDQPTPTPTSPQQQQQQQAALDGPPAAAAAPAAASGDGGVGGVAASGAAATAAAVSGRPLLDAVPPSARMGLLAVAGALLPYYSLDEQFPSLARSFPDPKAPLAGSSSGSSGGGGGLLAAARGGPAAAVALRQAIGGGPAVAPGFDFVIGEVTDVLGRISSQGGLIKYLQALRALAGLPQRPPGRRRRRQQQHHHHQPIATPESPASAPAVEPQPERRESAGGGCSASEAADAAAGAGDAGGGGAGSSGDEQAVTATRRGSYWGVAAGSWPWSRQQHGPGAADEAAAAAAAQGGPEARPPPQAQPLAGLTTISRLRLQSELYALTSAGGPRYAPPDVRRAAFATLDALYPSGRSLRYLVRWASRTLHLDWLGDPSDSNGWSPIHWWTALYGRVLLAAFQLLYSLVVWRRSAAGGGSVAAADAAGLGAAVPVGGPTGAGAPPPVEGGPRATGSGAVRRAASRSAAGQASDAAGQPWR